MNLDEIQNENSKTFLFRKKLFFQGKFLRMKLLFLMLKPCSNIKFSITSLFLTPSREKKCKKKSGSCNNSFRELIEFSPKDFFFSKFFKNFSDKLLHLRDFLILYLNEFQLERSRQSIDLASAEGKLLPSLKKSKLEQDNLVPRKEENNSGNLYSF